MDILMPGADLSLMQNILMKMNLLASSENPEIKTKHHLYEPSRGLFITVFDT